MNWEVQKPKVQSCERKHNVRTNDGGRFYLQCRYRAQLLCMKGHENQVENSTNELPASGRRTAEELSGWSNQERMRLVLVHHAIGAPYVI